MLTSQKVEFARSGVAYLGTTAMARSPLRRSPERLYRAGAHCPAICRASLQKHGSDRASIAVSLPSPSPETHCSKPCCATGPVRHQSVHFVLAQQLYQNQFHVLPQPTDVIVTLEDRRPTGAGADPPITPSWKVLYADPIQLFSLLDYSSKMSTKGFLMTSHKQPVQPAISPKPRAQQ